MKIEDIKPGDVLFRSKDGKIVKVDKVTPDGLIQHLAYTDMVKSFHVFLKPIISSISAEYYEPATDEQRQYMDSKLADFYGTNTEAANKRITALASMMGDLKQENNELAERVKQLMDDYNRVVKLIDSSRTLSDLVEALDKLEKVERDRDFFKKEYDHGQKLYESLSTQYDEQTKELKTVREACKAAEDNYNELLKKHTVLHFKHDAVNAELPKVGDTLEQLQDYNAMLRKQLNTANANCKESEEKRAKLLDDYYDLRDCNEVAESLIARFENADIENADFSTMAFDCPHGVEAKVCSAECLGCEHCLTHGDTGTRSILCAYNYDQEKEKEQYLDKLCRQMNRCLNS